MKRFATGLMAIILMHWAGPLLAVEQADFTKQLERERDKLQREKDPVDRTKINIKISEVLLASVSVSIQSGDYSMMERQLNEYSAAIEDAHRTMVDSGRNAQKKAGGFKDLEIALRKQVQRLDDLGRLLTVDRRPSLERVKGVATTIRNGLLKALFP